MAYNLNTLSNNFLGQSAYPNNYVSTNPSLNMYSAGAIKNNVLGAQDQSQAATTGGGGGSGSNPVLTTNNNNNNNNQNNNNQSNPQAEFNSQLDAIMNSLPDQLASQQSQVNNSYNTQKSSLDTGLSQGEADLANTRTKTQANQAKTLTDLADSMRNQFMRGQVMLGASGAGDSSAANQYAYALTKMGNKQRGDITSQISSILSDIDLQESKMKSTYNQQLTALDAWKADQLASLSQWYADKQNTIRQSKASDAQQRSQQAMQYAMSQAQMIQSEAANKRGMLDQWAANHATTINEARQMMNNNANQQYNQPVFAGLNGNMNQANTGNSNTGIFG
jgi:hypothetical protein